ncbi:MAG: glycosyltransferase family A protein [Nitriliruptorales bacterium]|nr:glycosyltransferase family A protein [Nitriliruptorales bacterium]
MSTATLDVELIGLDGALCVAPHAEAHVVLRVLQQPVGVVWMSPAAGVIEPAQLWAIIRDDEELHRRVLERVAFAQLAPPEHEPHPSATWSVAVCTRDRPQRLARTLASLAELRGNPASVVVVDNASSTDETRRVAARFDVEYVEEPRPGLNHARRRAATSTTSDVLVYTDDDVLVEPDWGINLVREFTGPRVGAATGLVLPHELETAAQRAFELRGAHSRGFRRRDVDFRTRPPRLAGGLGAGASLAVRRELVEQLGLFDAALDMGSPARTGGDTYAIYLVMRSGHRVVYTPAAVASHVHRRTMAELEAMVANYSTGGYTWMLHALISCGDLSVVKTGLDWFRLHHLGRNWRARPGHPAPPPRRVALAELRGIPRVPSAYLRSRRST